MTRILGMRRGLFWTLVIINLIALPFLYFRTAGVHGGSLAKTKTLPIYGEVRSLNLIEMDGRAMTLENFKGRVWVLGFIFTRCVNQCPLLTLKMGQLQRELPSATHLASVTVDPAHDTPEVLSAYAEKMNVRDPRWHFLTGKKASIDALLTELHLNNSDDPNLHSLRLVLVDPKGQVRGYYDTSDGSQMRALVQHARDLQPRTG